MNFGAQLNTSMRIHVSHSGNHTGGPYRGGGRRKQKIKREIVITDKDLQDTREKALQ